MIDIPGRAKTLYVQVALSDMLNELGEDNVKSILSSFSCPLNSDIEYFLKTKAIEMSKRNFAKTYLVFWQTEDGCEKAFVGYYALAAKPIIVDSEVVSNRQKRKLREYGIYDEKTNRYIANATLIGQLGKNYSDGNDTLISGTDLLQLAMDKAKEAQIIMGGRFVYLECEDKPKLLEFYKSNNFIEFGKRQLDRDEVDKLAGQYLIQLFTTL